MRGWEWGVKYLEFQALDRASSLRKHSREIDLVGVR